jgi:transaldolase
LHRSFTGIEKFKFVEPRGPLMNGLEYIRLLKNINPESEVWWDASPVCLPDFQTSMVRRYPALRETIDTLLPQQPADCCFGMSGATTNPRLINAALFQARNYWTRRIASWSERRDVTQASLTIYNQLVQQAAAQLETMWHCSGKRLGWLSAQVDPRYRNNSSAMVEQGLELSRLAPNIMIKVPGSQAGYDAIEQLVAQGCSINNTFCFTVSQFAAGLEAIERGRFRARLCGMETAQARYVITFMIGRFGAQSEFDCEAKRRGITLTPEDKRWAELAVYEAIQTLRESRRTSVRLLLSSIKLDSDGSQGDQCWHLERTGERTTLYTLPAPIIEFLLRRQGAGRPVVPARSPDIPRQVLNKLLRIDYFSQAYLLGGIEPANFSRHPAFITALQYACAAQPEREGFIESVWTRQPQQCTSVLPAQAGACS